jgi:hypothetical protein
VIEPGIAETVARVDAQALAAALLPLWAEYRACPICRSASGVACCALNGAVVGGVPDGVRTDLRVPHAARQRRTSREARK